MSRILAAIGLAVVLVAALTAAPSSAVPGTPYAVSIYAPHDGGGSCSRVFPLKRFVVTRTPLRAAMQALLAGPTAAERARGYGGWFSGATAGHLIGVRIANGVAFVDFHSFARHIPNASSSCGSALLLAQLDRTAKQFRSVDRTIYSFDGSPKRFYEWLQRPAPVTR